MIYHFVVMQSGACDRVEAAEAKVLRADDGRRECRAFMRHYYHIENLPPYGVRYRVFDL